MVASTPDTVAKAVVRALVALHANQVTGASTLVDARFIARSADAFTEDVVRRGDESQALGAVVARLASAERHAAHGTLAADCTLAELVAAQRAEEVRMGKVALKRRGGRRRRGGWTHRKSAEAADGAFACKGRGTTVDIPPPSGAIKGG